MRIVSLRESNTIQRHNTSIATATQNSARAMVLVALAVGILGFAIYLVGLEGSIIRGLRIAHEKTQVPGGIVTISLEVAAGVPGIGGDSASLNLSADRSLYLAKGAGRGQVKTLHAYGVRPASPLAAVDVDQP